MYKALCKECTYFQEGKCTKKGEARAAINYACGSFKLEGTEETNEPATGTKVCTECGRELPLEAFGKNRWGYTSFCKDCLKEKRNNGASKEASKVGVIQTAKEDLRAARQQYDQLQKDYEALRQECVKATTLLEEMRQQYDAVVNERAKLIEENNELHKLAQDENYALDLLRTYGFTGTLTRRTEVVL